MHRIVWISFKAIFLSVLFVVVWTVAFYLFRAYTLNQRVEAIMTTMQQEVARNNYLTPEAYDMYQQMFIDLAETMNGGAGGGAGGDTISDATFVYGYSLNYTHDSTYVPGGGGGGTAVYARDLSVPANFGDIAIIELQVGLTALSFRDVPSGTGAANAFSVELDNTLNVLTYTYQVPCMKYISIT